MSEDRYIDRLAFLAEKFDVFESTAEGIKEHMDYLTSNGYNVRGITNRDDMVLAFVSFKKPSDEDGFKYNYHVSVSFDVFNAMVISDPSNNKMYTQWMLTTFQRYLKANGQFDEDAIRFVDEDLPLAKEFLLVFEKNKRKKKFRELNSNEFVFKGVNDPTDINQYKSLSQLYDAVDPFIEKDPSNMEKLINGFVKDGKAEVPVRDRKFTLYIPKCEEASLIFGEFVGWCTAKKGGDMFNHYTNNSKYRKPNGQKSDIYIIIDNRFFEGKIKSDYLYQIHFESNQVRDRIQSTKNNFFENVLLRSEGVSNFFHEELTNLAKMIDSKNRDNIYIDYLIKFGWTDALFEIIDDFTPIIRFTSKDVPRLPDISKFKNLNTLIISDAKLTELHPSIGSLGQLEELLIPGNNITELPKELGRLKNLVMINIIGNKIKSISDDIKYLDKSNGGSLHRISFNREEIGEDNYHKLKELLPSVKM